MQKIKKSIQYVSGASYYVNIHLSQECVDLAIFDTYEDSQSSSVGTTENLGQQVMITGITTNQLSKLRTFSQSPDLNLKYVTSTSPSVNGLNLSQTLISGGSEKYVYYIDNVTYTTTITSSLNQTIFSYKSIYGNPVLFDNKPILKDDEKMRQVEKMQIEPDVFIIRQNLPVLIDSYRLSDISKIDEFYEYGSGYFNIIDNF